MYNETQEKLVCVECGEQAECLSVIAWAGGGGGNRMVWLCNNCAMTNASHSISIEHLWSTLGADMVWGYVCESCLKTIQVGGMSPYIPAYHISDHVMCEECYRKDCKEQAPLET